MTDNGHRHLEQLLQVQGAETDITQLVESRGYTVLSYAAFKNHSSCFKILLKHAMTHNVDIGSQKGMELMKAWIDSPTDEEFTALHFAVYHGNWDII